jgi:hypothetical protein
MFERTGRRLPFQSVHIHVQRCLWDAVPVMRPAVSGGGISSVVLRGGTALYVDLDADLAAIDDLCLEPFPFRWRQNRASTYLHDGTRTDSGS